MGGKHQFDFGEIKMTPAIHGSSYEIEGETVTLGLAAGIIFSADKQTIYHAGDTALFTDMKLIGAYKTIDVAFLPIGDNYTMGPEDAIIAASYIQAKKLFLFIIIRFRSLNRMQRIFAQAYLKIKV